jgi:DNA-binding protein YbaB
MGDTVLEELNALHREAVELAQHLAAVTHVNDRYAGRDPAGAVEVTVAGNGSVSEIHLDPAWRDRVLEHGLGSAVVAAVSKASAARFAAQRADPVPAGSPQPPYDFYAERPGDPASAESNQGLREVLAVLEALDAELDGFDDLAPPPQVTAADAAGRVRVTMTGRTVTSVDVDEEWLAAQPVESAEIALGRALRDAAHRAAAVSTEKIAGLPAARQVLQMAHDPEALLRRLGLRQAITTSMGEEKR